MAQVESKKKDKPNLRYQRDKDRELVNGMFKFYEVPGGELKFRLKLYKEDPIEKYVFKDGQHYKIPLGVAKHLNKSGSIPQHAWLLDENGKQVQRVTHNQRRYGFFSTDFMEAEDLGEASELVKVENVPAIGL